jgi:hypothetical protein
MHPGAWYSTCLLTAAHYLGLAILGLGSLLELAGRMVANAGKWVGEPGDWLCKYANARLPGGPAALQLLEEEGHRWRAQKAGAQQSAATLHAMHADERARRPERSNGEHRPDTEVHL